MFVNKETHYEISLPNIYPELSDIQNFRDLLWYRKGKTGNDIKNIAMEMGINLSGMYWWTSGRYKPGKKAMNQIAGYLSQQGIELDVPSLFR